MNSKDKTGFEPEPNERKSIKITKLKATANNNDMIFTINKLIDEVIYLRSEVERLDRIKAKRQVVYGGRI